MPSRAVVLALAASALALTGCLDSARLNPFGTGTQPQVLAARPAPQPLPAEPAPIGRVETQALPPPVPTLPGSAVTGAPTDTRVAGTDPNAPAVDPGTLNPSTPKPATPRPVQRVAAREEAAPAATTRTSVTGSWSVKEATGGKCRLQLSSSSSLDIYRASTSGCQDKKLSSVTGWDLRGGEIYLFAPGGEVVARQRASGRSAEGSITGSGAPVSMSK